MQIGQPASIITLDRLTPKPPLKVRSETVTARTLSVPSPYSFRCVLRACHGFSPAEGKAPAIRLIKRIAFLPACAVGMACTSRIAPPSSEGAFHRPACNTRRIARREFIAVAYPLKQVCEFGALGT